jgi:hypothetical protein
VAGGGEWHKEAASGYAGLVGGRTCRRERTLTHRRLVGLAGPYETLRPLATPSACEQRA